MMNNMELNPFVYQRPNAAQVEDIEIVRRSCENLYTIILQHVPQSAERTLAIRKLEEVSMWVNKAIVFGGQNYLIRNQI
jgi:hypothetical protein